MLMPINSGKAREMKSLKRQRASKSVSGSLPHMHQAKAFEIGTVRYLHAEIS
jgi:hypothetical protein